MIKIDVKGFKKQIDKSFIGKSADFVKQVNKSFSNNIAFAFKNTEGGVKSQAYNHLVKMTFPKIKNSGLKNHDFQKYIKVKKSDGKTQAVVSIIGSDSMPFRNADNIPHFLALHDGGFSTKPKPNTYLALPDSPANSFYTKYTSRGYLRTPFQKLAVKHGEFKAGIVSARAFASPYIRKTRRSIKNPSNTRRQVRSFAYFKTKKGVWEWQRTLGIRRIGVAINKQINRIPQRFLQRAYSEVIEKHKDEFLQEAVNHAIKKFK